MSLLQAFLSILELWRPAFCKKQAFDRIVQLALVAVIGFGRRKTITSLAINCGRCKSVPSADYKIFSESPWDPEDLFDPILKEAISRLDGDTIVIAVDDTKIRKTGKKIPNTAWYADPLGPPFQTNLIWGARYLQFSLIMPHYKARENHPPRAIPVRFIAAPHVKKPGKKATQADLEQYAIDKKTHNLSTLFVYHARRLRATLDEQGFQNKKLVLTVDGSFCNKGCMSANIPRTTIIARCRKNTRLCFEAPPGSRKVYSDETFTPEQVRTDDKIPWKEVTVHYGGCERRIRCKEVSRVLWQNGTHRKVLRLIVIAPIPYVRDGIRNYRDPAYILTTDLDTALGQVVQDYLDRWQIEYNFRDEKSFLGVGEAQVRNAKSTERQPAFHVATYSAVLLAKIILYGDQDHPDFGERPGWRPCPKRNTVRALIGLLTAQKLENPEIGPYIALKLENIPSILRKVA
jgi:hypothetical protein